MRWPVLPMVAVIIAGPLETAITLPGTLASIGLTRVATAYALVAVLGHALLTRHRFRGDQAYALGIGLACLALLAAAASPDPTTSFGTAGRLVTSLTLFLVVSEFGTGERLRTAMWAYATVTAAVTVPALSMFVTGQTTLLRTATADPNDFAVLMAIALPMAVLLAGRSTPSKAGRAVAVACIGLLAVGVLLTLSRGSVVGLAVGTLWHLAVEVRHRRPLGRILLVGLGLVLLAAARLAPLVAEALTRKEVSAGENVTSRLAGWRLALDLAAQHPTLGVGPGLFGNHYRAATDTPATSFGLAVTHNTYLGVLTEMGVPALLVLLVLLGLSWTRLTALRAARVPDLGQRDIAATLRTCLLVGVVAVTFSSQEYNPPLWLLVGLTGGLVATSRATSATRQACC